jgi:diamine N-acetyltransferase
VAFSDYFCLNKNEKTLRVKPGLGAVTVSCKPLLMKNNVSITAATIADAITLQKLGAKTFYESFASANTEENMQHYMSEAFAIGKIRAELVNPNSRWFLCHVDGVAVGYLKLNFGDAQTEANDNLGAEIERIYVDKDYQQLKLGKLLMEKAFELAAQEQRKYIWLGVWEHNTKAIGFYKHFGFEHHSSHSFILGTEQQTDLILRKDL